MHRSICAAIIAKSSMLYCRNRVRSMEPITYLVANYNKSRYLDDCLKSLHDQTDSNWHCLILDDASTDHSLDVISPWLSDRVRLIRNPVNLGAPRSLARLVENSPTDIVGILDADDALYPEATEVLLETYRANSGAGFVYSNCRRYDESLTTPVGDGLSSAVPPGRSMLTHGWVDAVRTFRVREYRKTAGFDPQYVYAEDRDIVFKMEEVTPLLYVDRVLYKYRQVPGSETQDPVTRRIGLRSQRRAYRAALERRGIRGRLKLGYLLVMYRNMYRHGPYPRLLRSAARRIPDGWRLIDGVSHRDVTDARRF